MYFPFLHERVRVQDRVDEFLVVRVDHLALVADLCTLADPTAIERGVAFARLAASRLTLPTPGQYDRQARCAVTRQVLRSSRSHIDRGPALFAQAQDSLLRTQKAIRTSHQLLCQSDRVIARAQQMDRPEPDGRDARASPDAPPT